MTIWFVTPAFQRYELSAVCFDQRLDVIRTLAANGIAAQCVVVADDENIDLARERGFAVVERDNQWLGQRFNDGIEYACRNGASRVVPIGSDSWIDPAFFLPMTSRERVMTGRNYFVVKANRAAEIYVSDKKGVGPLVLPRHLLKPSNFRPAQDEISRGVDRSTILGIEGPITYRHRNLHPFQYVGFRGIPHLSSYEGLVQTWGVQEYDDPWSILARHYPMELVDRARQALTRQVLAAA